MARKTGKNKRTEPRFTDSSSSGIRTSQSGRVSRRKQSRKSSRSKNPARPSALWCFIRFCLRPLPRLTYWGAVFGLWGGIIAIGIIGFHAAHLPNADDWAIPERPPNMRIVAHDATLISNRGLTGGKALRLEDMSPYIPQAVIAIEDHRFYSHFGFDPIGFGRAMFRNAMQKRLREGGSTITQQLAKNLFLTPDRTFGRKVQELVLSFWLEANFTKAEILELYLNRVYFGAGATGVDAAARRYFGKAARDVTIAEAAMLAGLLKAPSRFSPARNPELAQRRAETVLAAMQREGFIKSGAIDMSRIKPGENARHFRSGPEHFAADMIVKQVHKLLGAVDQDIVVETTLSPYMMTAAHEILAGSLDANGEPRKVSQAALVAMAPNGAIRALIGGRDYGKSQFNRAVEARRQPGSAFKPFVWLNAVERGYEPKSTLQDTPVRYGKWRPENYDQTYRGSVSLADALAESVNTIAARLTVEAGPDRIAATARRLGVESKMVSNASLALGTSELSLLELTAAYAPFANGGVRAEPHLISRITTGSGKLLFQRKPTRSIQVVRPRELGMMNTMLKRVVQTMIRNPAAGPVASRRVCLPIAVLSVRRIHQTPRCRYGSRSLRAGCLWR